MYHRLAYVSPAPRNTFRPAISHTAFHISSRCDEGLIRGASHAAVDTFPGAVSYRYSPSGFSFVELYGLFSIAITSTTLYIFAASPRRHASHAGFHATHTISLDARPDILFSKAFSRAFFYIDAAVTGSSDTRRNDDGPR